MYKRTDSSDLGHENGNDFIRISDELVQNLNQDLKKYKFISRNSREGEEVEGLCEATTLIDEKGILYLKGALLSQTCIEKEVKKFLAFIDRCLQHGNVIIHRDAAYKMCHKFVILDNIPSEIESSNDFQGELLKIYDQFIMEHYDVFKKVEMYWNDTHKKGGGFNYYGVTILTPEMTKNLIDEIERFLENNESEEAEYFLGEEYNQLMVIFNKSISENKYVIHFGI